MFARSCLADGRTVGVHIKGAWNCTAHVLAKPVVLVLLLPFIVCLQEEAALWQETQAGAVAHNV